MGAYKSLVRPLLFQFDAETMHRAVLSACAIVAPAAQGFSAERYPSLALDVAGLRFPAPVGLGAGFDKSGTATRALAAMGFGSIEIGSVSAAPSAGNPVRPRLFRLPADQAILVFYGVPNDGADAVAARLRSLRLPVPLGISIIETNTGQPKSLDTVIEEFRTATRALAPLADYVALNLQCPNSETSPPWEPSGVSALLSAIDPQRPVFLKIAASADPATIDALLQAVEPYPFVRGFILSTLLPKPYASLRTPLDTLRHLPGSLSGAPLKMRARELVSAWYARIDRKRHALVAVGGVQTGEDAYALIRSGATLVQLVTSLIYEGPRLPGRLHRQLAALLERDGFARVADAVGATATAA
jgi:dihydroorotate dehydrogenase